MTNPILAHMSRNERRAILDKESSARRSGQWGAWKQLTDLDMSAFKLNHTSPGSWVRECHKMMTNNVFSVFVRRVPIGTGNVLHLAISSMSGDRPSFHEMQRIKNEMTGAETTGVEIYPPDSELIDGADMFHLWVLPGPLPFSLHHKLEMPQS